MDISGDISHDNRLFFALSISIGDTFMLSVAPPLPSLILSHPLVFPPPSVTSVLRLHVPDGCFGDVMAVSVVGNITVSCCDCKLVGDIVDVSLQYLVTHCVGDMCSVSTEVMTL